jgi:hypothetical protein
MPLRTRVATLFRSLPPWALYPSLVSMALLGVAVFGFYWDVAQHIDNGRDTFLLTPAHTMIVIGLLGVAASGLLAVRLYPQDRRGAGTVRILGVAMPAGALFICACGFVALAGFPLDDIWHRLFGKDVTLWGPTHLLMIGGASFSTIGQWLLITQAAQESGSADGLHSDLAVRAGPSERAWRFHMARATGAILAGLSTFQAEYDFGVPQFRMLYHPVLIALAAGFGLTVVRRVLGRGAAIRAAVSFIVIRGLLALALGAMGHTVPHFPLYLAEALLVELCFAWGPFATGVAIGTVGFAAEYAWSHTWMPVPWSSGLVVPGIVIGSVAAIAGCVLGSEAGRRLVPSLPGGAPSRRSLALAGIAVLVALAIPYPRHTGSLVTATVDLARVDGGGVVTAKLDPPDAARRADFFQALSWQGGGHVIAPMRRIADGAYRSERPVPVGGNWKTSLRLARGTDMKAIGISFPRDPETGKAPIPAAPHRVSTFGSDAALLLREAKTGVPSWLVTAAYVVLALVVATWIVTACIAFGLLTRGARREATARHAIPVSSG